MEAVLDLKRKSMESIRRKCCGLEDGNAAAGFGRRICFGIEDGIAAAGLVRRAWNVLRRAGMYEQDGPDVRVLDPSSSLLLCCSFTAYFLLLSYSSLLSIYFSLLLF